MRVRLGTPFQAGVVQEQNAAVPRLRRRCDSVHPLHFRGRSSSAERSFDMREAKRAALFVPTIFEGIAQSARADASHASGRRRKSSCPHHFCPCGVVQPTCLPLMQEITGAKPVRDANFCLTRGVCAFLAELCGVEPKLAWLWPEGIPRLTRAACPLASAMAAMVVRLRITQRC